MPNGQCVWSDGNDGVCHDDEPSGGDCHDRPAYLEYHNLYFGWTRDPGAGGGDGGAVYRGRWFGAGVFEAGGIDGGAVCCQSIWRGGDAHVSHGGSGALEGGGAVWVFWPGPPAGKMA